MRPIDEVFYAREGKEDLRPILSSIMENIGRSIDKQKFPEATNTLVPWMIFVDGLFEAFTKLNGSNHFRTKLIV